MPMHFLSLRHPHFWSRLLGVWRGDPVLSNSEIKFKLHSENTREVHLRQKLLCVIKLKDFKVDIDLIYFQQSIEDVKNGKKDTGPSQ